MKFEKDASMMFQKAESLLKDASLQYRAYHTCKQALYLKNEKKACILSSCYDGYDRELVFVPLNHKTTLSPEQVSAIRKFLEKKAIFLRNRSLVTSDYRDIPETVLLPWQARLLDRLSTLGYKLEITLKKRQEPIAVWLLIPVNN